MTDHASNPTIPPQVLGSPLIANAVPSAIAVSLRLIDIMRNGTKASALVLLEEIRQLLLAGGWAELDLPIYDPFKTAWAIDRLRRFLVPEGSGPFEHSEALEASIKVYERQTGSMNFIGTDREVGGSTLFFHHPASGTMALLQHRTVTKYTPQSNIPDKKHLTFRVVFGLTERTKLMRALLDVNYCHLLQDCRQETLASKLEIEGKILSQDPRERPSLSLLANVYSYALLSTLAKCNIFQSSGSMATTLIEGLD